MWKICWKLRWHARGGQGAKTGPLLLGRAAMKSGYEIHKIFLHNNLTTGR